MELQSLKCLQLTHKQTLQMNLEEDWFIIYRVHYEDAKEKEIVRWVSMSNHCFNSSNVNATAKLKAWSPWKYLPLLYKPLFLKLRLGQYHCTFALFKFDFQLK